MARGVVVPNGENGSLEALTAAAQAAVSRRSHQRLLAIKSLLLGIPSQTVADLFGVTRRTVQRWIGRFNRYGIDGLLERARPGRPRQITAQQSQHYRELITHPAKAGQTHWTAKKFHGYLRNQLQHEVGYRTVVRWLHDNQFRLKVPQPWPDRQDEETRQAFVRQLRAWLCDPTIELWYCDEMGVEGDPRPRRRWARRGEKTRRVKNGDHLRMNVCGMICPRTGQFYALEFSHSDQVCFQAFLTEANRDLACERPRNLLICDNASWHKGQSLDWGRFEPVFLPPYSPDLNPIERLWLVLKAEWFADFVARTQDQLLQRLDRALQWAIQRQPTNQRTCAIRTQL